jgi:hypothetical protein
MRRSAQVIGWAWVAINAIGVVSGLVDFVQSDLEGRYVTQMAVLIVIAMPGVLLIRWGRGGSKRG